MSNLITNGTFSIPQLATNSFLLASGFGGQLQGWTTLTLSSTILINGTTTYNFPSNTYQYLVLLGVLTYANQSITIPIKGLYLLTFSYSSSLNYLSGKLFISIGSSYSTTITYSNTTVWTTVSYQIPLTAGTYTLSFYGGGPGGGGVAGQGLAITNISITAVSAIPDLSSNIFTKSSVYGNFIVQPKYSTYDINGNPSGSVVDSGDSTLYGNLTVSGKTSLLTDINVTGVLDVSGKIHTANNLYVDGKVGIGTNTPAYPLDVSGIVRLGTPTSNIVIYPDWIYGSTGSWINMPTGTSGIGTGIGRNAWMASVGNYTDWVNDSVPGDIISRNIDGRILFSCNNSYAQISLSSSSLIIGNSSNYLTTGIYGSLGIGGTTPSYPLDVVGDIHTSGDIRIENKTSIYAKDSTGTYLSIFTPCWDDDITYFAYGSAGMNIRNSSYGSTMFLNSSNQVGIGTTTPAYPLDVIGDIRTSANFRMPNQGIIYAKNVAGASIPVFFPCWVDNITYLNYGSAGCNIRNSSSVNTMFFNNSNQVGIGTITPAYTLDVCGNINCRNNITTQKLGIAIPASSYALDVSGDFRSSGLLSIVKQLTVGTGATNHAINVYGNSYVSGSAYIMNQCGIGRTNPNYTLDVSGNTHTTGLILCDTGISIAKNINTYPLDVSGIIFTNTSIQSPIYNFNYSTIPTLTTASSGYATTASYATLPLTPASSSAYAITITSLPIGVYLIQGYVIGTFITTAITNIRLGLNTSATAPTTNNYTQQILPILSTTQVQSISYSYYLSNTAVTTYYIVFATGASFGASSVTGFTASFIRIA